MIKINKLNYKIIIIIIIDVILTILSTIVVSYVINSINNQGFTSDNVIKAILNIILIIVAVYYTVYFAGNAINKDVQKEMLSIERNILKSNIKKNKENNIITDKFIKIDSPIIEESGLKRKYTLINVLVTFTLVSIYVTTVSFWIFSLILLSNSLVVFMITKLKNQIQEKTEKMTNAKNKLFDYINYITNSYLSTTKISSKNFLEDKFNDFNQTYRNTKYELEKEVNLYQTKTNLLSQINNALFFILLAWFLYNGTINIGVYIALLSFSSMITMSLVRFSNELPQIKKAQAIAKSTEDEFSKIVPKNYYQNNFKEIEVSNDKNNYKFSLNSKILIKGKSGSGKSTIINNILNPKEYKVKIDNEEVVNVVAPNDIILISNNKYLLNDIDIYENIKLGRDISDEVIKNYVNKYELQHLLSRQKLRNEELSEGEKQRIEIIRGIIDKPKVLILDEAFNNLDKRSKKIVREDIFSKFKTIIEISHEEEIDQKYDKIYNIN